MKLSVIVPVYNVENYLARCVDSILGQSMPDLELILVNDGSTDRSPALCDDYARKDPRVVVIHKENAGQSDARNRGLDIARGDYVAFVDSDDYVDIDMFRSMLVSAETRDADIVTCQFERVEEDGTVIPRQDIGQEDIVVEGDELLRNFFHAETGTPYISGVVWGKLYKRTLFDQIRFPRGRIYEDTYVIPFLYERTRRMVLSAKPFYKYQIRQGSTVNCEFSEKRFDSIFVGDAHYQFFSERPQYGQTDYALAAYTRAFMSIYYAVYLRYPSYKRQLCSYKKEFVKNLPAISKNQAMCRLERLSVKLMLICPRIAMKVTRKYFPYNLPNALWE